MVFLYKVTVHTNWSQRGKRKRITKHEKDSSIGKRFIFFASRDVKQERHKTFNVWRLWRIMRLGQGFCSKLWILLCWTFRRFVLWIMWFVTHFLFLTFEIGYCAKLNSTFLEPVKVDEMADCPRSYSKLIGEKRWSFCKKRLLSIFLSAKQAHITTDTYGAIRQALW